MEISKCLGCMEQFQGYPCPRCGFDPGMEKRIEYALPMQTILAGKYLTGKVLGQGSFSITYIGWDISLAQKVAIKEYYPTGQVSRSPGTQMLTWRTDVEAEHVHEYGIGVFLKEARRISMLNGIPGVVRVRDLFQENNTAYIVMDFVEGQTLKRLLEEKGPMTWEQAKTIFEPVLKTMERVHGAYIIHWGLHPENLMITKDGGVKILDLDVPKNLILDDWGFPVVVYKSGFSPLEQYFLKRGRSGPWTDVYSLAATIYYTLTGKVPPVATDRVYEDNLNWNHPNLLALPAPALEALKKAMAVKIENRTQTMAELAEGLFMEVPEPPKPSPKKKRPKWLIPIVVAVLASLCGVGLWMVYHNLPASSERGSTVPSDTVSAGDEHTPCLESDETVAAVG